MRDGEFSALAIGDDVTVRMAYGPLRKGIIRKLFPRTKTATVDVLTLHGTDTTRMRVHHYDIYREGTTP